MKTKGGVIYGAKADAQIQKVVRQVLRQMMNGQPWTPQWSTSESGRRRAVLNEDATGPSSPLVAMNSFDAYFINKLDDGTSELDATGPFQVKVDDPDFTAERGTLIRVEECAGGWMIYYAACSPDPALITALDAM